MQFPEISEENSIVFLQLMIYKTEIVIEVNLVKIQMQTFVIGYSFNRCKFEGHRILLI